MQQILRFLKEVRTEFDNISWPKKESLFQLTFVVISISLIISLILGGFDYLFTKSFSLIGQTPMTTVPTVIIPQVTLAPTITLITPTTSPKSIKK